MATSAPSITFSNTSDVNFRAWGSAISTALAAVGLVQTSDTGQINWTTATRPSVGTSVAPQEYIIGYEVWRFADSLQATKPIYLKLEYGEYVGEWNSNPNHEWPVLYLTVASATNGAGTMSGITFLPRSRVAGTPTGSNINEASATATPSQSSQCYFSSDGSYITFALDINSPSTWYQVSATRSGSSLPAVFFVDRIRDTSGAITDHGVVSGIAYWHGTGNQGTTGFESVAVFKIGSHSGSNGTIDTYIPYASPGPTWNTGAVGSNLYTWPLPLASPSGAEPQCLATLAAYQSDLAVGSVISVPVLGSTHSYLSTGAIASGVGGFTNAIEPDTSITNLLTMLLRYE